MEVVEVVESTESVFDACVLLVLSELEDWSGSVVEVVELTVVQLVPVLEPDAAVVVVPSFWVSHSVEVELC